MGRPPKRDVESVPQLVPYRKRTVRDSSRTDRFRTQSCTRRATTLLAYLPQCRGGALSLAAWISRARVACPEADRRVVPAFLYQRDCMPGRQFPLNGAAPARAPGRRPDRGGRLVSPRCASARRKILFVFSFQGDRRSEGGGGRGRRGAGLGRQGQPCDTACARNCTDCARVQASGGV